MVFVIPAVDSVMVMALDTAMVSDVASMVAASIPAASAGADGAVAKS